MVYDYLYNSHNTMETAAHWTDFPWRPANNVNATGLPDPLASGSTSVHVADRFFDVENPRLLALHRAYVLHSLDELGGSGNLFLGLAFQYSGPLEFERFFLDTVAEWERRTGRRVRVALTAAKDVTDAVLADPVRSRLVSVVDMRYWQYRPDGSLWAPPGGQNLAFREMIARDFGAGGDEPPATTPLQAYRQVREYRDRYPDLALVAWENGVGPVPAFMAGASQVLMRNPNAGHGQGRSVDRTPLDGFVREHLASDLMHMKPEDGLAHDPESTWALSDDALHTVLLYSLSGPEITLARDLPAGRYRGLWFDPATGATRLLPETPSFAAGTRLRKPGRRRVDAAAPGVRGALTEALTRRAETRHPPPILGEGNTAGEGRRGTARDGVGLRGPALPGPSGCSALPPVTSSPVSPLPGLGEGGGCRPPGEGPSRHHGATFRLTGSCRRSSLRGVPLRSRRAPPPPSLPRPGPMPSFHSPLARALAVVLLLLFVAVPLAAQTVEGRLTSRDTGAPIPGAVVHLVDGSGTVRAEGLTDAGGAYSLRATAAGRYRLRSERVGYESVTSPEFDLSAAETRSVPLVSAATVVTLEGLTVESGARRCRVRPEGAETVARVWDEARKALNAVALTQAAGRVRFDYETYRRRLDPAGITVLGEQRRAFFGATRSPFHSVSAERLAAKGFMEMGLDSSTYYAPDAAVLLSDVFLDGHCFQLHAGSDGEDGRIGLDFRPVRGGSHPDVAGTLWLDRRSSELREVDYHFVRLPIRVPEDRLGGRVAFERVPSGTWVVKEWSIRMPEATIHEDVRPRGDGLGMERRSETVLDAIVEEGGEIRAVRPEGAAGAPGRATLSGLVADSLRGGALQGARVYLSGTSFAATSDASGRFRIADVPAGSYLVGFLHPSLAALGYQPAPLRVELRPDQEDTVELAVPTEATILARLCPGLRGEEGMVVGRVEDAEHSDPVQGAHVRLTRTTVDPRISSLGEGGVAVSGTTQSSFREVATDARGVFRICGVLLDDGVELTIASEGYRGVRVVLHPNERRIVVRDVSLEPQPAR